MEHRFFYHSFPRPRCNETIAETSERGFAILESIKNIGFVLAPEIVKWNTPINLGPPSPVRILQRRICFTELSQHELAEHAKHFGPFAIEFDIGTLRSAGALPVIYMPQFSSEDSSADFLGTSLVGHLESMRFTFQKLHDLKFDNPEVLSKWNAHQVKNDAEITLKSRDKQGVIVQEHKIAWENLKGILDYLEFENAPFERMATIASILQSLFYPTDDSYHNHELGYYRQREWRITSDYNILDARKHSEAIPRARVLQDEEKKRLLDIDNDFWFANVHATKPIPRVDESRILTELSDRSLLEQSTRIIVPDDFRERAYQQFGDMVTTYEDG